MSWRCKWAAWRHRRIDWPPWRTASGKNLINVQPRFWQCGAIFVRGKFCTPFSSNDLQSYTLRHSLNFGNMIIWFIRNLNLMHVFHFLRFFAWFCAFWCVSSCHIPLFRVRCISSKWFTVNGLTYFLSLWHLENMSLTQFTPWKCCSSLTVFAIGKEMETAFCARALSAFNKGTLQKI